MHLLVIEDDADTRANLRDLLELDDYTVEEAGTLAAALARPRWDDLQAVLLDRRLPDGTAESALPRLRQLAPDVPVIIMTGYADIAGAITALRQGAADYILKPIDPSALRSSLARLLEQHRTKAALRQAEHELRAERDFAEALIEHAQAIVLLLDWEGRIIRFNPFMESLCGFPLEEVRGQDWFDAFTPVRDRAGLRQYFLTKRASFHTRDVPGFVVTRAGEEREIRWSSRTLRDAAGQFQAVLAIGHDVTALIGAQQKAVQAERLAAIGEMITGLTHESRNALQRSKACLEMLAMEVQDRPEALDLVHRIERAQDHLQRLYEEVRSYAAPLNLRRERGELASLWRETWSHVLAARTAEAEKKLILHEEDLAPGAQVEVDRFAIGQVFRNVFENAWQATPQQGRIELCAETARLHGRPAVRVSIRDNGPGIAPELRTRVFEPFFTTKTKGTGLGMAIASRIVQAHGGEIAIGNPAMGAEIVLTLPLAEPASDSAKDEVGHG